MPANGAQIAELSAPTWGDSVTVDVPAGEYTTLLVRGAGQIEVTGLPAESFVVTLEARTVFAGQPEEAEALIPLYLPPPDRHPQTGWWAVRLRAPAEPGEYRVTVACRQIGLMNWPDAGRLEAVLRVHPAAPESDVGFGFYTDWRRYAYPEHERLYLRDMAAHGANTFTPYGDAARVAEQVNAAIEEGLLDTRFPVFAMTSPQEARAAQTLAEYPWPELVVYTYDEPPPEAYHAVAAGVATARGHGLRAGTSIKAAGAWTLGHLLDVAALLMDSFTPALVNRLRGSELWAYNCRIRGTNAPLHRYYTGAWTWAVRPRVNLVWAYAHQADSRVNENGTWQPCYWYEHALGGPEGPIATVGLEGFREGVVDYRVLRALEERLRRTPAHADTPQAAAWLRDLRDRIEMGFWPGGVHRDYGTCRWDVPDTAVPPVDGAQMRREALEWLRRLQ